MFFYWRFFFWWGAGRCAAADAQPVKCFLRKRSVISVKIRIFRNGPVVFALPPIVTAIQIKLIMFVAKTIFPTVTTCKPIMRSFVSRLGNFKSNRNSNKSLLFLPDSFPPMR